jgi:hypothetical protein
VLSDLCNQLSVPVRGEWKACALAARPFATAWDNLEDVVRLEQSLALSYNNERVTEETPEVIPVESSAIAGH